MPLYKTKFDQLFKNKNQAVTLFCSLERRYLELCQQLREKNRDMDAIIKHGHLRWQRSRNNVKQKTI